MQGRFKNFLQHRRARFVLEIILLLFLVLAIKTWLERDMVEGMAPPLTGSLSNGQAFELNSLRGKPVLVHFWASWCPICKLEQDNIEAISRDHSVITIAMQSGQRDAIQDYMAEEGLSFAVLPDEQGDITRRYGVSGVPASFILAPDGRIVFRERGYTTEWGLRFRLWLTQLF